MPKNSSHWIETYKKFGALWIHDGNPRRPHALLTSGRHSSGYFNSSIITENPFLIEEACVDLVEKLVSDENTMRSIDVPIDHVIGPALGAVVMSFCMAQRFQHSTGNPCRASFTEKIASSDGPKMVLGRSSLRSGDRVLVVEDVLTTGGSVDRTIDAVVEAGGNVAPLVAVLVNRSGLGTVRGERRIVSLIDESMPLWKPEECPLCQQSSEALRPKDADNWARLNASY